MGFNTLTSKQVHGPQCVMCLATEYYTLKNKYNLGHRQLRLDDSNFHNGISAPTYFLSLVSMTASYAIRHMKGNISCSYKRKVSAGITRSITI